MITLSLLAAGKTKFYTTDTLMTTNASKALHKFTNHKLICSGSCLFFTSGDAMKETFTSVISVDSESILHKLSI